MTSKDELVILSFRADGSFAMTSQIGKKSSDQYGEYVVGQKSLTLRILSGEELQPLDIIALSPNQIHVRGREHREIVVFTRISSDPGPLWPNEAHFRTPEGRREAKEADKATWSRGHDIAVLNNARMLAAAADQYFLETGRSTAAYADLVGTDKFVKAIYTVANEIYPLNYTQGITISIQGVEGVRTVTYAP
jgi:hypothetical protein